MFAVIGLGTNIGSRQENLLCAVRSLGLLPGTRVTGVSRVYETAPVGYADQADFLNICARVETLLSPEALLGACLGIEAAMGRVRQFKNGPRVIDLDLLVYEGETRNSAELTLPHPRIGERAFVLCPLEDLFSEAKIPGFDFSEAAASADRSGVRLTNYTIEDY